MKTVKTRYGLLNGVVYEEYYKNGMLKDCVLAEKNVFDTPAGRLVPQYKEDSARKKHGLSLSFYENGAIARIALDAKTSIESPVGRMAVELVTFYKSGNLLRVFPLNGQISGFWTEQNEYGLAEPLQFDFKFGRINAKVICIHFYDGGPIKSLTFWPRENPVIEAPCGRIRTRFGLSLYESGAIKSIEPFEPTEIKTPVGIIPAYDIGACGICGDSNSLLFAPDGTIEALKTTAVKITGIVSDGKKFAFSPSFVMSHFSDDVMALEPMTVKFKDGSVYFDGARIPIDGTAFNITKFNYKGGGNTCNICGK